MLVTKYKKHVVVSLRTASHMSGMFVPTAHIYVNRVTGRSFRLASVADRDIVQNPTLGVMIDPVENFGVPE